MYISDCPDNTSSFFQHRVKLVIAIHCPTRLCLPMKWIEQNTQTGVFSKAVYRNYNNCVQAQRTERAHFICLSAWSGHGENSLLRVTITLRRDGMVRKAPITYVGPSVCLSRPTERISVKLDIEDCMKICRNILVLVKISAKISRPFH